MDRLLTVLTIFSLVVIIAVFLSIRRAHIRVEYSVSWLTAALLILIVSFNGNFVHWLADLMGVDNPPVALLVVMFGILFVVNYRLSLRVSALKDANIALAQRVAILEYQLKSGHEERKESNKS
jgi:hypothetical protein